MISVVHHLASVLSNSSLRAGHGGLQPMRTEPHPLHHENAIGRRLDARGSDAFVSGSEP